VIAARLESPLPRSLPAGSMVVLYCSGTGWGDSGPVKAFEFVVDGVRQPAVAYAMPRFDMPCRRSGFWGIVAVHGRSSQEPIELRAALGLADGTHQECELGRILVEQPERPSSVARGSADGLVAICMGTFEPDLRLFATQIDSIRSQTDTEWVCVISDDYSTEQRYRELRAIVASDQRFTVSRAPERAGFYRNFERALKLAPAGAELLALCDQDDVWHPDKLSTLRGSLGSAVLAYSDMRLVDDTGRVLRDTLWKGRSNNSTSLASMLIANTVTGASTLFRREVAQRALPFPDSPGLEFHDHWIALVALASGDLVYVDRPLYDYVQHPGAILGNVAEPAGHSRRRRRLLRKPRMREWRAAYFLGYIPGEIRARTLLLRCGHLLTPAKRRDLERYHAAGTSVAGFVWLVMRPMRRVIGRTETLGGEWELALGIVWRHLAALVARLPGWPERWTLDTQFPDPSDFEQKRLRRWRERV
jgi:glycosyltransferase involved in cell wall biosynthesis